MTRTVAVDDAILWRYFVLSGARISLEIAATLGGAATREAKSPVELAEIGGEGGCHCHHKKIRCFCANL
jgi:hypothetical protein